MGVLLVLESRVGAAVVSDSRDMCGRSWRSAAGMCVVGPPWVGTQILESELMAEDDDGAMQVRWGVLQPG